MPAGRWGVEVVPAAGSRQPGEPGDVLALTPLQGLDRVP